MAEAAQRSARERRFYGRMAVAMAAIVFIGFAPSFYLRGLIHVPRPNTPMSPVVWAHGLVFTTWMLLFWWQTRLIAAGNRLTHMKLGVTGFGLALVMLGLMFVTAIQQVARANQPPFIDPVSWTAVPLSTIPQFVVFLWLGWQYRRDAQAHKRAMLILGLLMMEPAIGRFPLFPPSFAGQYVTAFLAWATILPLVIWDRRTRGDLHWMTLLGLFVTAAVLVLRFSIWTTAGWHDFVKAIA